MHLNATQPVSNCCCWVNNSGDGTMYLYAELVDCDKLDDGCNGGFPSNAYHEIQRLGE